MSMMGLAMLLEMITGFVILAVATPKYSEEFQLACLSQVHRV